MNVLTGFETVPYPESPVPLTPVGFDQESDDDNDPADPVDPDQLLDDEPVVATGLMTLQVLVVVTAG
jgi:hypothetical protein